MADEDDEEVIFENSPLEKYLREAGFTEIEPEKVDRPEKPDDECKLEEVVEQSNSGLKGWMLSFNGRFSCLGADNSLSTRKDYATIVINSGTLSEDDYTFLHQFDSELFDIQEEAENITGQPQMLSLSEWTRESILSIIFLLLAVFLASTYWNYLCDHKRSSIGALLVISILGYYVWSMHSLKVLHRRNIKILKDYTSEVKTFVAVFRKSVMLIQELELISKGYTLVGLGMQIGYQQKDGEGESTRDIYPKLRQSLCDNGMDLLMRSCSTMEKMFVDIPFAIEVTSVFTCISSNPLIQFGLGECAESEKLSLHYLKILLSAIASQQSEFLGRFLLSLSEKARSSDVTFDGKSFERLFLGFYDQLAMVTKDLKSLQLSYHLHKSALTFTGDSELHHDTSNNKPQSKWTQYFTSVHSLELHLKACLTRMQFMHSFVTAETENESKELITCSSSEDSDKDRDLHMNELEYNYNLLRNELDSAICCWEEGFHSLRMISGVDKSETITTEEGGDEKEQIEEHSSSVNLSMMMEPDEVMGDCVFEGYTDFDDDSEFDQKILTREELEKESRSREENQHLLLELRNVLLTKAKDPLITEAGFVKPSKKQKYQDENGTDLSEPKDTQTEFLVNGTKINDNFKVDGGFEKAQVKFRDRSIMKEITGEGMRQSKEPLTKTKQALPSGQWSSKAFSMAIQEAAISRGTALMEESYGSSDSD